MSEFKYGDRVVWSYFIGRFGRRVMQTKEGDFAGYVRHTRRYFTDCNRSQLALVGFDGNCRVSRVPVRDLRLVKYAR
jgi:hypothetical protein